jgi:RHS repeat-associated protein
LIRIEYFFSFPSRTWGDAYLYTNDTGRELDDTDLYYYRARYYDPTTQRFLSQDPIEFSSGDFNFYRYVGNSPGNFRDPSGLYIWELIAPTDMGSNTMITIDKNGNKSVYDFDTGKSRPYWNRTKTYCETQKKPNNTKGPKPPVERSPKTKFQKTIVFLEIIIKMFK